jgi:putative effector of murein hydrolase LrgA (UPF0299 family)
MKTAKVLNWVVFALGVWEVLSAFLFMRWAAPVAFWNAFIVGALILLMALIAQRRTEAQMDEGLEWVIAGVSLWLVISPFLLAYDLLMPMAMWNDIIVGVVSLLLALRAESALHKEVTSKQEIASEES